MYDEIPKKKNAGDAASAKPQIQHSIFKIQNYLNGGRQFGLGAMLGLQPAEGSHEADLRDASCGPPPPGGCGPHGPDGPVQTRGQPAAERTGLRRGGAALRPGAAAGCGDFLRSRKLKIQNAKLKMNCYTQRQFNFGALLRRAQLHREVADLRRRETAARRSLRDRFRRKTPSRQLPFRAQLPPRFPTVPQSAAARAAPRYSGRSRPPASRRR